MSTISNRGLKPQPDLRLRIAVVVALVLCVAAAFAPLIGAGWVYDDMNLVRPSPALKDLSGLFRSISTDLYSQAAPRLEISPYWRPLAMASFWLDTRFGKAPLVLHIGNIILHALAAALLALVIMRRHGGVAGVVAAAAAAAWWAFHPENVEPVAWISCRYDLLCCVALLGLLAIPWRPGLLRAAIHGLVFLAGLLSKEGFAVMAVVIVAMDFGDRRPAHAAAPRWIAVGIALVIWVALRAVVGIRSFDTPPPEAIIQILFNYMEAIAIYFWRALVPPPLTISHPYTSGGVFVILAGAVIIAGLITTAILWRRAKQQSGATSQHHGKTTALIESTAAVLQRRLAVPVAIFLAWFIPVAGAMTMFHEVGERYLYVPSIGLALVIGELVAIAVSARHRIIRIAVPAAFGIVIVLGFVRLEYRLPDWRSDDILWAAALRVNPLDPLANHYRAIASGRRDDWSDALKAIEIAARGDPDSGRFATTYAWVLMGTGNFTGVVREAERATTLAPYMPDAWFYLAVGRHMTGDHAGEVTALDNLLQIAPGYPGARKMREVAACEASGREDCFPDR